MIIVAGVGAVGASGAAGFFESTPMDVRGRRNGLWRWSRRSFARLRRDARTSNRQDYYSGVGAMLALIAGALRSFRRGRL